MEKKATLIVMDYESGRVYIIENPNVNVYDSEAVEDYLCYGFSSSIHYMITFEENPIEYLEQI